jgi:4-amino-4-deoxy-L-arabinose transferase-like glycosyltransferase
VRHLVAVFVLGGIGLRVAALLGNPPLGLDEARLALNIAARTFGGLLQPLDHDQSAPPLYLLLQRAVVLAFGVHDWALRLLPLAFGIALVVLTPATARRLLPQREVAVATLLAACSPLLVHYSVSVKQYGAEAALALLAVGMMLSCREASYRGGPAAGMTAFGALLPWLAAPAPFVLSGAVGCALADLSRKDGGVRSFLVRSVPLWAASFARACLIAYQPASDSPYLRRYWSTALLAPSGDRYAERLWALANENLWGLALGYPGPPGRHLSNLTFLGIAVAILLLLAIGARWQLKQQGWGVLTLVLGPLLAAIGASFVGLYPVSLRLTLFAAPLVQLLFLAGLQAVTERMPEPRARRSWVLAGAALACPLVAVSLLQLTRGAPEDVRSLVQELTRRRREEPVYVFAGSIPPWLFYSTDWKAPDRERLKVASRLAGSGGVAFENAPSRDRVGPELGAGLAQRSAAGPELYGIATGIEWTPSLGPLKRITDDGWTETEADRVTALEGGVVWVLMSHLVGSEAELLRELERRGACATFVRRLDNAILVRYAVPPGRTPGQCTPTG